MSDRDLTSSCNMDDDLKDNKTGSGSLPSASTAVAATDQGGTSILGAASTLATLGSFNSNRRTPSPHAEDPSTHAPPSPSPGADDGAVAHADSRSDEVPMTFPQRLMEILSKKEHADIISWLDHGKGFMIFQKKRFAVEVMPKYFKQAKYTSFTRKLNRWGFTRVSRGQETGAYYHRFFQRNNLRLCLQMTCQPTKPCSSMTYPVLSPVAQPMDLSMSPVAQSPMASQQMDISMANLQPMQNSNMPTNMTFSPQETTHKMLAAAAARRETLLRLSQLQQQQLELLRQQTATFSKSPAAQQLQLPSQQLSSFTQNSQQQQQQQQQQQLGLLRQHSAPLSQTTSSQPNPSLFYSAAATGQGITTPFSGAAPTQPVFNTSQMMETYLAMVREKARASQASASATTAAQPSMPSQSSIASAFAKPPSPEEKSQQFLYPNVQTAILSQQNSSQGKKSADKRGPSGARRASAA